MCSERIDLLPESPPRAVPSALDRRDFLKVNGAGLLGVALLGSVGAGEVLAQRVPSPGSSLVVEFEEVAEEYGVPMELLMAMDYVSTRWEMPQPEANAYERGDPHGWGSYGIMALVQNPYSDTLGEASRLTGIAEEDLKTKRAANIRGGAALLASSAGGLVSLTPRTSTARWPVGGWPPAAITCRLRGSGEAGCTPTRCSERCGRGLPRRSYRARWSPCRSVCSRQGREPLWPLNRRWYGTRPTGPTSRRPTGEPKR